MNTTITKGQAAYIEDCKRAPNYHTGEQRKKWEDLGLAERATWERNPTPREYRNLKK